MCKVPVVIQGQKYFLKGDDDSDGVLQPKVFASPCHEHARFLSYLSRLDENGSLPLKILEKGLITAVAQFTFTNWEYQMYAFRIFHRTKLSMLAHLMMLPFNLFFIFAILQRIGLDFTTEIGSTGSKQGNSNATFGDVACLLQVIYILALGMASGKLGWTATNACFLGLLFIAGHPGYSTLTLADCCGFLAMGTFLQTISHTYEDVPPRSLVHYHSSETNANAWGMPYPNVMAQTSLRKLPKVIFLGLLQTAAGCVGEFWANFRLVPYVFLYLLWKLGYDKEGYDYNTRLVQLSLAKNQPAVDFIGTGGGARLSPSTLADESSTQSSESENNTLNKGTRIFLYLELVHYLAGFIGCAFMPHEIPLSYFPLGVEDCEGAHYVITGVLAPVYLMLMVAISYTLFVQPSHLRGLSCALLSFFLALVVGDIASLRKGEIWTERKLSDGVIHVILFCAYAALAIKHSNKPFESIPKSKDGHAD